MAWTGVATAAMTIPIALLNSSWWRTADQLNGGNFNMQIGWPDAVDTIARIRDSLPVEERATVGILAGDEGVAGVAPGLSSADGYQRNELKLVPWLRRSATPDGNCGGDASQFS